MMTDTATCIARIQAQLSSSARQNFEALPVPPFTIYVNADSDSPWNNYAIPDEPVTGELQGALDKGALDKGVLDKLCKTFRQRQRQPRFEFVAEFAPALVAALRAYGFVEEMRTQLMICTPTTFGRPATNQPAKTSSYSRPRSSDAAQNAVDHTAVPQPTHGQGDVHQSKSYSFEQLDHAGELAPFQEFMTVQQAAFGAEAGSTVDAETAAQFRRRFATTQFFAARVPAPRAEALAGAADGSGLERVQSVGPIVCVASLLPAYDGLTEIAGIATAQAYRRQGLATAVTTYAVAEAFAQGLTGVFLTAANAAAGRVYERVGFRTIGTGLAYHLPNQQQDRPH